MAALKIILLSVLAAVIYGIIHDQITARICVEYFTVGHPRVIRSESPTVLGFFWGTAATWWAGLLLGIGLALAARAGKRPKLDPRDLLRPLVWVLASMFVFASLAGVTGYFVSAAGVFPLAERYASRIAPERHVPFLVCGWAHSASYLAGFAGGISLWVLSWKRRDRRRAGP